MSYGEPLIWEILLRFEGWSVTVSGSKEDDERAKGVSGEILFRIGRGYCSPYSGSDQLPNTVFCRKNVGSMYRKKFRQKGFSEIQQSFQRGPF